MPDDASHDEVRFAMQGADSCIEPAKYASPIPEGTSVRRDRRTKRRLTALPAHAIIRNMKELSSPISDLLRRTIVESGIPLLQIQEATGVQRASLSRFVRGMNSLRLDIADKLANYFGLELRPTKRTQG